MLNLFNEVRIRKLAQFVTRHSLPILVIGALWAGACIYFSLQFKLYDEPGRWAPQNHPLVQRTKQIEERFGGSNHVVIMVTARDGDIFNHITLGKVKAITSELDNMKGVIPYTVRSIADETARYMKFETRDGEEFIINQPLMERAPEEGETEAIERIRWGAKHNPLIWGPLVSVAPDGKATKIEADFRTAPVRDTLGNVLPYTDPVEIYKQLQPLTEKYTDEHDLVEAGGTPVIIGWVNSEGLFYVAIAFGAFVLVIGAILFMMMRWLAGSALAVGVGLFASLSGFGMYYLFFGDVFGSAAVLIAPFIVVAAGACHAVQFLRRLYEQNPSQEGVVETFTVLFKPMLVALLSDGMAFVVLSFVPFENVSLLGQVTTFGLLSVTLAMIFLLAPAVHLLFGFGVKRRHLQEAAQRGGFTEALARTMVERRSAQVAVVGAIASAFVLSLGVLPKLDVAQDNTYAIHNALTRSWDDNEIYQMEVNIRKNFGGVYPLVVMVKTKGDVLVNESLEIAQRMEAFQRAMEEVEGVEGTLGLPQYLKVMNRLMYGGTDDAYTLPPSERGLAEYIFLYEDAEPGVFDAVVSPDHETAAIVVLVRDTSQETVSRVMAAAQAAAARHLDSGLLESVIGGGAIAITEAFNESIGKWLLLGTVLSAVGTFVIVVLMIRSVAMSAFLLVPLIIGIFLTLGLLYLIGIPMDSNVAAALAIASGVGIDSEVYLLYRFREEYAASGDFNESLIQSFVKIRRAILTSHVALILGVWSLVAIPLYVGTVGFTMGLILLVCFIVAFLATPALWAIVRPAYLTRSLEVSVLRNEAVVG